MTPQTTDVQSEKGERRQGRSENVAGYDSLALQISQLREELEAKFSATRREVRESGEETRREIRTLHEEVVRRLDILGQAGAETRREMHALQLEITESTLMANPAQVMTQLGALSGLGIRLAIDDFGTGYSSLAYLRRFPVDVLKIDRSFIADADRDAECQSIVRLVVGLADSLDLEVVAEGVERETQARLLKELGCHKAQGYYYARPLPGAAAARWLD